MHGNLILIYLPFNCYSQEVSNENVNEISHITLLIQQFGSLLVSSFSHYFINDNFYSLSSSKSQGRSYGRVCRYFNTPVGCRNGDKCSFIHHLNANSSQGIVNSASQGRHTLSLLEF